MTENLRNFIQQKAKDHVPFKRKIDNDLYQRKYFEIFEYILNHVPNLDESINVPVGVFKSIYRNYKQVLIDLYNDGLIFFKMSKSGSELIHGSKMFARNKDGQCEGHFSCFYRVDSGFVDYIRSDSFQLFSGILDISRYTQIYLDTYQMKSDDIGCIVNKYIAHQISGKVTKSGNEFYSLLTINGKNLLEENPHFGKYTDGRIYSKFHSLHRDIRKKIQIGDRGYIKEVFDISHCYPTLIGKLIEGHLKDETISAYRKYIMNHDIYSDTLEHAGMIINKENRNRIKPYFNKFILSTIKDNKRNMKWNDSTNDPVLFNAVVSFIKDEFPEIFEFIWNFETTVVKDEKGRSKRIKMIAHELQKVEKNIVDELTKLIPAGIPFVTLHDAIYIGEKDIENVNHIDFEKEFRKVLNF